MPLVIVLLPPPGRADCNVPLNVALNVVVVLVTVTVDVLNPPMYEPVALPVPYVIPKSVLDERVVGTVVTLLTKTVTVPLPSPPSME